jgi:hypothetical protein
MKTMPVLFALGLVVSILPAMAGTREDVMDASQRCAAIADDRVWLDCYYGAAQPMRAQLGLAPVPQRQLALVPPPGKGAPPRPQAAAAQSKPGFFGRLFAHEGVSRERQMVSYSFDGAHLFTVTLSDGSVWRQSPGDPHRANWRKPPQTYRVSVSEGYNGTGVMDPNDGFQYEVQRLR